MIAQPYVLTGSARSAALLAAWTAHYRLLGIERFHVAFHFPDTWRHQLVAASHELGIAPAAVSTGPWHEHTNTEHGSGR